MGGARLYAFPGDVTKSQLVSPQACAFRFFRRAFVHRKGNGRAHVSAPWLLQRDGEGNDDETAHMVSDAGYSAADNKRTLLVTSRETR